jgi:hypothetical protein
MSDEAKAYFMLIFLESLLLMQGVTKRCRLFGLTNNALVYER